MNDPRRNHHLMALALACGLLLWSAAALAQEPDAQAEPQAEKSAFVLPQLLQFVQAAYPERAAQAHIEADVILLINIEADGSVSGVEVSQPSGAEGYGFEEAAVEAAQQFVFTPATEGGVPVPVQLTYKYRFLLEPAAPAAQAQEEGAQPGEPQAPPEVAPPSGEFKGRLLERGTRDPLVGAQITIFRDDTEEPYGFEAVTDEEGRFSFVELAPGPWKILVEEEGYFPYRTREDILAQERTDVVYFVERGSYNRLDVMVEGKRVRKEVTKIKLQAKELEKIPGSFGDPLAAVVNLPGVARSDSFSGQLIVRGSSPRDTVLQVQGINVPIIYHFGGLRSVIPLQMIDSIDFFPGNFGVYYGRAIGGVLDVQLRDLDAKHWHGALDVNLFDSSVYLELPLTEDLSVAVAGRRSYIDSVIGAVVPDDVGLSLVAAPVYHDWQAMVDWRPSRDHKLKLFVFGSSDELELLFENPAVGVEAQNGSLGFSTLTTRGILEYTWTPNEHLTSTTRVSTGGGHLVAGGLGLFNINYDFYQPYVRETLSYRFDDSLTLSGGVDFQWFKTDLLFDAPTGGQSLDGGSDDTGSTADQENQFAQGKNLRSRDIGVFLQAEWRPLEELLLMPGLRVDYYELIDSLTVDPRLAARYTLHKDLTLKGGVGLFQQSPGADLVLDGLGNPDIGPESAIHYSLGAEWTPTDKLLLDTTFFYKDMFDLASPSDRLVERDGELVPEIYNNGGEGRVYGMELLLRHELSHNFFGWVSYTLSRSERLDYGETKWRLFDFDQTHILTLVGSYKLPRNWELGLRWRYVTGSPATFPTGGVLNVDSGAYEPVLGGRNTQREPSFHQLDLRLDKRWIYDTWNLNFYVDFQNFYNRKNAEGFSYNFDFSERQIIQSLPILPVIGVKAEF